MTRGSMIRAIYKTTAIIAGAMIFVAAILITTEAMRRYIWNATSIWANELAIYLLIASVWLGTGSAMLANWHVAIKFVNKVVPPRAYRYVRMFSQLICIAVGVVLTYYAITMTFDAFVTGRRASTIWAPRLVLPYGSVALGMAMFTIAACYNFGTLFLYGKERNYKVLEESET